MSYPVFNPPMAFFWDKHHRKWSKDEARQFYDWLLANIDRITHDFVDRLGMNLDLDSKTLLAAMGNKAGALLVQPGFFTVVKRVQGVPNPKGYGERTLAWVNGPKLTREGNSLMIDMNLLTARLLMRDYSDVFRWELLLRPKNAMCVHFPVIVAPDNAAIQGERVFSPLRSEYSTGHRIIEDELAGRDAWVAIFRDYENLALTDRAYRAAT